MKICMKALLLAAAAGLLSGCGDEAESGQVADDGRAAAGEVLEGSISDDMLSYDSLRSQPPLAELSDIPESEGGPPAPAAPGTEASPAAPEQPPSDTAATPAPPAED